MKKIDILSVAGYAGVFIALIGSLFLMGGTLKELFEPGGLVIAYFGATMGLFVTLRIKDAKTLFKILKNVFVYQQVDYEGLIKELVRYSTIARKEGVLALEREAQNLTDPFLKKALQMAVDGMSPEVIDSILSTEIKLMQERHANNKGIFDTLATFCPAFGMLGTIMGLSLTLAALHDPKEIGHRMAGSLMSTFYGVIGCYAIFGPIAKKLEKRSKEEILIKRVVIRGLMSIQAGDSPRLTDDKLHAFLK